ncbi:MAG: TIGR00725 family protein [Gemmatimonadales bacterium]
MKREAQAPRIAVVGGSRCTPEQARAAEDVGRLLAEAGAVLLCGGLTGVMTHAAKGARDAGGLTVGILPGSDANEANPYIRLALPTGMGEMRNALIVRMAQAVVAIGGGWGTLSEVALARRTDVPVIALLDELGAGVDLPRARDAGEAVQWVLARAS